MAKTPAKTDTTGPPIWATVLEEKIIKQQKVSACPIKLNKNLQANTLKFFI